MIEVPSTTPVVSIVGRPNGRNMEQEAGSGKQEVGRPQAEERPPTVGGLVT